MPKIKTEVSDWFPCPDDPYEGRVLVRLPKGGEIEAIQSRTREMMFSSDVPTIRMVGTKHEIAAAAIKDWTNFLDEDGKELKCTPANVRLMLKEDGFSAFIDSCLAELERREKEKAEVESKN